jgi:phosphatidate cytidylyltransferase
MSLNNRSIRILVALIGIPLIITLCLIGKIPFLVFVLVIGIVAFMEFSTLAENKDMMVNKYLGIPLIIFLILNTYEKVVPYDILFLAIPSILLIYELFRNKQSALMNIGATFVGMFYIGLFSSALILIREFYFGDDLLYNQGGLLIISMMFSIWACDSAAYFIGSAIGKHKMFPRVSPNKSWEGGIAGFIFAVAAFYVFKILLLDFINLFDAIVLGIIVGTVGQLGDLIESLLKRDAEVKDSSALIPGHGGVFDRFDSLLLTAPIVYIYMSLFL